MIRPLHYVKTIQPADINPISILNIRIKSLEFIKLLLHKKIGPLFWNFCDFRVSHSCARILVAQLLISITGRVDLSNPQFFKLLNFRQWKFHKMETQRRFVGTTLLVLQKENHLNGNSTQTCFMVYDCTNWIFFNSKIYNCLRFQEKRRKEKYPTEFTMNINKL